MPKSPLLPNKSRDFFDTLSSLSEGAVPVITLGLREFSTLSDMRLTEREAK